MRAILAAMTLLLATTTPALAQSGSAGSGEAVDHNCTDDNLVDRCTRQAHERMRALYEVESPEDLLARGVTMRRAMFVDGYGRDLAAITFWRKPGHAPMVDVRTPRVERVDDPQPLRAAISARTWSEVLSASTYFDRELAPLPSAAGEDGDGLPPLSICLHSWVVVVEAVDAPRVAPNIVFGTGSTDAGRDPTLPVEVTMTPASVRSDTEDACAAGLATDYAYRLAEIALRELPECSSLERDDFRNEADLLALCHQLRGDRLVAAEASVVPRKLQRALETGSERELSWLFVGTGTERQERYLAAIDGGWPYFKAPTGIDPDHAVIEAEIVWDRGNGQPAEQAILRLNLLRVTGEFGIDTFELSERRPQKLP